jgi:hypothetical protein
MQRWEYLATHINIAECNLDQELNKLGSEGWEMVSHRIGKYAWDHHFIFKRFKD